MGLRSIAVSCLALSWLALSACAGRSPPALAPADRSPALPALAYPLEGGGDLALADHRGQVVVLDVWATYCKPCRKSFPLLARLAADRPDVLVVGLSLDEEDAPVAAFLREVPAGFPIARDRTLSISTGPLQVTKLPTLFVIDAAGRIRLRLDEPAEDDYRALPALVDALRAEAPAPPPAAGGATTGTGELQPGIWCGTKDAVALRLYNDATRHVAGEELDSAVREYEAALARDPRYCDAMDNLAVLARRRGDVDRAIALYERSLALAPRNQIAWTNVGVAYRMKGRLAEAAEAYRHLTELAPDNAEGWFGLGQLLILTEQYDAARPPLRRAEALYAQAGATELADAHLLLGLAAAQLRDWPEVRKWLEPLAPQLGSAPGINLFLAEAYLQPDALDRDKARRYLDRARDVGDLVPAALWKRAQN